MKATLVTGTGALAGLALGGIVSWRLLWADYRRGDELSQPAPRHTWWFVAALGLSWAMLSWQLPRNGLTAALPACLALAQFGAVLTWIDLDVHRLPNALVLPAYPVA